jgi:phosphoesterase RecJ-like protein
MLNLSEQKIRLKEILDKSQRILITISAPDGDSIGSSIALKYILEQLGKDVDIVSSFDLGGRFSAYTNSSSIIVADLGRIEFAMYNACFTIDAGQLQRLVRAELHPQGFKFPSKLEVVNIDHHESNDLFGTLNINIPDASCTAEVMDALFDGMYTMDSYIATLMYFSVVFDTGNFRFNIKPDLFEFAEKCVLNGANTETVLAEFFTRSILQTKYEAVLLSRLEQKDNYAYTFAYHSDIEQYGIDVGKYLSATSIIARDYLSSFKGVDFAWVISERKHDMIKIEMRGSIDDTPILDITHKLGGGGHKRACGAKVLNKTIDDVQKMILQEVKDGKEIITNN